MRFLYDETVAARELMANTQQLVRENMANYDEFHDGEWDDLKKSFRPRWKKMHPKEARGMLDPNMQTNDARRENREMRKRMARRLRRIEKREMRDEYDLGY